MLLPAFLCLGVPVPGGALEIQDGNPDSRDRRIFREGADSINPSFLLDPAEHDLSGIGIARPEYPMAMATLIGPRLVVANHFRLGVGQTLVFTNRQGREVQTTIVKEAAHLAPLRFYFLADTAEELDLAVYPMDLRDPQAMAGETVFCFGWEGGALAASRSIVDIVLLREGKYLAGARVDGFFRYTGGDSNAPVFSLIDGKIHLLGTAYATSEKLNAIGVLAPYAAAIESLRPDQPTLRGLKSAEPAAP